MKQRTKVIIAVSLVVIPGLIIIHGVSGSKTRPRNEDEARPVAVEVTPVSKGRIVDMVTGVGTVSAMQDVRVSSETAGRIVRLYVKVGDKVRAGQTLVLVDDELKRLAVDQSAAQLLAAETAAEKAHRDYERAGNLHRSKDISDAEMESYRLAYRTAEAQHQTARAAMSLARRQLADTRIKAPISGIIASTGVETGELVAPGREIANIVDMSRVKVQCSIPEEEVVKLRLNQDVLLVPDASPEARLEGSVYSIGSKPGHPAGHSYPVEIIVENRNTGALKVGMFVRVEIRSRNVAGALLIPREAVWEDNGRPMVYVAESGRAKARPLVLGIQSGRMVEILDGVKDGEHVISFGQNRLKEGSLIRYSTH